MTSFKPKISQHERKKKGLALDFISSQALLFLVEGNRNNILIKEPLFLNVEEDPKTFSEAMSLETSLFGERW